jgi:hypothetical protein
MTTNCQTGPCPNTAIGPIQLCASAAECFTATDTCGPLALDPTLPIKVCNPSDAGTAPVDGGDAAPETDAAPDAPVDAPTGG